MRIEKIDLPQILDSNNYPPVTIDEINYRYNKMIQKMNEKDLSQIIVYGDREHSANLSYLTGGYDSRFEETLLIIKKSELPVFIVGNEGYSYSNISLLKHEKELFQTFSLQGQIRDRKRYLSDILKKHGINQKSKVGIIGLKYYESGEVRDPDHTFDIPHYIIKEIEKLIPLNQMVNATGIMTHPENGLRCNLTHHEIARFEFMSNYLSNQMKKVINSLKIGISEVEVLSVFDFKGIPFVFHPCVNFGPERVLLGVASPSFSRNLKLGDVVTIALGVEGSAITRTGYAVSSIDDFSDSMKDIINDFYFPYFKALKAWYESIRIGTHSIKVYDSVMGIIGDKRFGVTLNPGHQIHMEEWINSPFRQDYDFILKSGMAFQCDIIAFPGTSYIGVHVEDTLIIADDNLKNKLKKKYPQTWKRIEIRQNMLKNILGINIGKEVMPLSNLQAILYPFLLDPNYIIIDK